MMVRHQASNQQLPNIMMIRFTDAYTIKYHYNAVQYNISVVTEVEYKSEFVSTKDTPYLTLTGELWCAFCEDFGENWSRCNGTALYMHQKAFMI